MPLTKKTKKLFFILLPFVLLFSSCSKKKVSLQSEVHKIVLDNGLTCLLVKREGAPIFSSYVRVKVGNIEEPVGETGLAHFFEHMAFKGTPTIGASVKNEYTNILQRNGGGDLNATTTNDYTSYFVSLPTSKMELWAYMESERRLNPVLREFDEERNVVLEERRMRYDADPDGHLYEAYVTHAFKNSPYKNPVIGWPTDINNFTPQSARSFYDTYYIPSRIVVAIVGNFDLQEAEKLVRHYFGRIPKKPDPSTPKFPSEINSGAVNFQMTGFADSRFYIGFHRPAYPDPSDEVFDVIENLMCSGRTSRLFTRLVLDKKMAADVGCEASVPGSRLEGLFTFFAQPLKPYTNRQVEDEILSEIDKMKQEPATADELEKVKHSISADMTWTLKSNKGLASLLTFFESLTGSWDYVLKLPTIIDKIKPEDVQRVLRQYFVPENQVTVSLEKKS